MTSTRVEKPRPSRISTRGREFALPVGATLGAAALALLSVGQFGGVAQAAYSSGAAANGTLAPFASTKVAGVGLAGDTNPYSLAVVPLSIGNLVAGNVLAVNFNHGSAPGTGTTIVQINPSTGASSLFVSALPITGPVGIAINPVNDGVWVGSFGSTDGSTGGDLLILPDGTVKAKYTTASVNANPGYSGTKPTFDGVWGEGVAQHGGQVSFFYGTTGSGGAGTGGGQVWRIDPHPTGAANGQPVNSTYAQIATGLSGNAAAKALPVTAANAAGPQGFAYDSAADTLYVSNDADNTITVIAGAATATAPVATTKVPVVAGTLNIPENIAIDPTNGDLLVVNAGNNTLVELNPASGAVVGSRVLDSGTTGALFGLAVTTDAANKPVIFYANDNDNTLNVLHFAAVSSPTPAPTSPPTATPTTPTTPTTPVSPTPTSAVAGSTGSNVPTSVQAGNGGLAASRGVPIAVVSALGLGGLFALIAGRRRHARR